MTRPDIDLALLIGSRICHDLISPVGAISNGLELLELSGAAQGPEMELIADSVANAQARIRFFRIAFGGARGEQLVGRPEILSILDDMNGGGRLEMSWRVADAQPRPLVRAAFLAMQCCESAMPYGGKAEVHMESETWQVRAAGSALNVEPPLWSHLENPGEAASLSAAQVQFALLPQVVASLGRQLATETSDAEIRISF